MSTTHQLETVNFHGDDISVVVGPSGEKLVAMKPICEAIGLQWDAQRQRIQRHVVLNSVASMAKATAADGKTYEYICLPLEYLNGWLFGVDAARVKEEVRDKVIEYQLECFQVLHDHFHGGGHAKSVMQALSDAVALMESDKKLASMHGMALARWKKIRKQHIRAVEQAARRAQLLLGF